MLKKRYLFLILIICLFAISAVSAEEIDNDTNMMVNDYDSGLISESVNEDTLSVSLIDDDFVGIADNGTFTDLQKKIDDADEGAIIDLENDYTYDFSTNGITINKNITINGNGYVIDALRQSMIFYITSPTVTLNNITFKNGYTTGDGGAIYFSDSVSNVSISGVFVNNSATYGGAIRFESGVSNSTISGVFVNNSAYCGGAIDFDVFLSNGSVSNVSVSGVFVNNSADCGGAIQFDGGVSNVSFSNVSVSGVFVNNSVEGWGGAIGFDSGLSNVSVSGVFVNNSADWGGAIYFHIYSGSGLNVSGEFVNNSADDGGAIYFLIDSGSGLNVSGEFVNNSARNKGGAIRFGSSVSNVSVSGVFVNNSADDGGAFHFEFIVSNSTISGVFVNNSANAGGAIYFRDSVSGSTISGVFVNNSGGGAIDFYLWASVSNSTIINSVVLDSITPRNFVFINNWFGNNAFNYESEPYSNCESWLFLDGSISPVSGVDGNYTVVFTLDNLYNSTSKSITHPDISELYDVVFDLSATNGYLNKYSARPGESIIFTSTVNKGSIVTAKYNNVSYSVGINNIKIDAPDVTKYYRGPERFVVTVKEDNKPVVGKDVIINLNGKSYTRTTDNNGAASMAINLGGGIYNVTSEFEGIKVYSTITVKTTIESKDITKIFRNDTQYYATFRDSNGNLLRNTDVNFNINGVFYTRTTDSNGVARMNINLNPNQYVLTAMNPVSGESCGNLITVLPNIVENHDLTKYYKNASKFTFRLLNNQGKPVGAGVSATLNINGVFYTRQTDANGYINMNINLNPSTYIVTIIYNGLSVANTIKILPILEAKNVVMNYRDGTQFEAKLLDGQGKPYANQAVTFNINGVMYNRITGDDGIARLNINLMPGEYIITSMYSNGAAISNKITIRSNVNANTNIANLKSPEEQYFDILGPNGANGYVYYPDGTYEHFVNDIVVDATHYGYKI